MKRKEPDIHRQKAKRKQQNLARSNVRAIQIYVSCVKRKCALSTTTNKNINVFFFKIFIRYFKY